MNVRMLTVADDRRMTVWKALRDTYGDGAMVRACATQVSEDWDRIQERATRHKVSFERELANVLWNWFSGGDAATSAALLVTERMNAHPEEE